MAKFYVVICMELGWDCICGVFDHETITLEELQETFGKDCIIFEKDIEFGVEGYLV